MDIFTDNKNSSQHAGIGSSVEELHIWKEKSSLQKKKKKEHLTTKIKQARDAAMHFSVEGCSRQRKQPMQSEMGMLLPCLKANALKQREQSKCNKK